MPTVTPGDSFVDAVEEGAEITVSGGTVEVAPLSNDTLALPKDVTITIEPDATLKAPPIGGFGGFIAMNEGCVINGGGTVHGNVQEAKDAVRDAHTDGNEHAIAFIGSYGDSSSRSGATLRNITVKDAPGGDCVYINRFNNVTLDNVRLERGFRNCLSIISGEGIVVKNSVMEGAYGSRPKSGIGIEPNPGTEMPVDVRFDNVVTKNNVETGFYSFNDHSRINLSITATRVKSLNNGQFGFDLNANITNGSKFADLTARGNDWTGFRLGNLNNYYWNLTAIDNCQDLGGEDNVGDEQESTGILVTGVTPKDDDGVRRSNVKIRGAYCANKDGSAQEYPVKVTHQEHCYIEGLEIGDHPTPRLFAESDATMHYNNVSAPVSDFLAGGGTFINESFSMPSKPQPLSGPEVEPEPNQSPYPSARSIPGRIEAENFDSGGESVSFHETTTNQYDTSYRDAPVDIRPGGTGYVVGFFNGGQWLEYTADGPSGTYNITLSVATEFDGESLQLAVNGSQVATSPVPNTGDWSAFQKVTLNNVSIPAGQKVIRVTAPGQGVDLDYMEFDGVSLDSGTDQPSDDRSNIGLGLLGIAALRQLMD